MTTRYDAVLVVFEHEIREDDAESLLSAIRHLRGVESVHPHVTDVNGWIAYAKARNDLEQRLREALRTKRKGDGDQ